MKLVERINSQTGKPYKVLLVARSELVAQPLWFHKKPDADIYRLW